MVGLQYLLLGFIFYSLDKVNGQSVISNPVHCVGGKCLKKCCPENQHVIYKSKNCSTYVQPLNISIPVYDDRIELTGKKFEDVFILEPNAFKNTSFRRKVYQLLNFGFNVYMTESAVLYLEYPNAYSRWMSLASSEYCIDYLVPATPRGLAPKIGVWGVLPATDEIKGNYVFTAGMILSCIFLILVLVVYSLLPELRNIAGLVLMAYVFSVLCSFIFLMVVQRGGHSPVGCVALTLVLYFFFLASFCWMNIMSYDIWWTFRGYAKARAINRRGEKFKFAMYSLYAFGVPLAMSAFVAILNFTNMKHIPWFIAPKIPDKGCFLEGGEKLLYLYTPMLIMIVLNWLFFLMTAFNIWRLSRGTAVLDAAAAGTPAAHRTHRNRLLVYLKLSILMGLNWILEVVSFFKPDLTIWYFTDAYNLLIGLAIFLIFVCKKKIYKKLKKRLLGHSSSRWTPSIKSRSSSRSNSISESTHLSQDPPTQISINPRGSAKDF